MKTMPKAGDPVKMQAALDVQISVNARPDSPDEVYGRTDIYLDIHRYIAYKSIWRLKTKEGAMARQKRETIQFLTDLKAQIDDVLAKIDAAQMDEYDTIGIESFAYTGKDTK